MLIIGLHFFCFPPTNLKAVYKPVKFYISLGRETDSSEKLLNLEEGCFFLCSDVDLVEQLGGRRRWRLESACGHSFLSQVVEFLLACPPAASSLKWCLAQNS